MRTRRKTKKMKLSILYLRCPWNSLSSVYTTEMSFQFSIWDAKEYVRCEDHFREAVFQFSIWDAAEWRDAHKHDLMAFFQFSIWDAYPAEGRPTAPWLGFQFSIWDATSWRRSWWPSSGRLTFNSLFEMRCATAATEAPRRRTTSFNSLFEMLRPTCRGESPSDVVKLSILYLRCWEFLCLVFAGF